MVELAKRTHQAKGSRRAPEKVVLEGGLSEDQVHEAVRIAATVHAPAVALEIPMAISEARVEAVVRGGMQTHERPARPQAVAPHEPIGEGEP